MNKEKKKGKFVVFEGIDGCGKGTQILKLVEEIMFNDKYKQYQYHYVREPTYDSVYGRELRELMAKSKDPKKDGELFCEYMVLDREHHCNKLINPLVDYGSIVICDRYKYSTFAYQQAQGVPFDYILEMHEEIKAIRVPDKVFIEDVPAKVAMERIKKSRQRTYKFEQEQFLEKVRGYYLELKDKLPEDNIIILDGTKSIEQVFEQVKSEFEKLF